MERGMYMEYKNETIIDRDKQELLNKLYIKMIEFNEGDPARIQHLVKVHSFAKLIGEMEGLEEKLRFTLEAAALVHDIGIRPAEDKYGSCNGKLQEEVGPAYAETMLEELGFCTNVIERVSYLVAHHHTYRGVEGLDYRILLESDFLVNLFEDGVPYDAVLVAKQNIFMTESGKNILDVMFTK